MKRALTGILTGAITIFSGCGLYHPNPSSIYYDYNSYYQQKQDREYTKELTIIINNKDKKIINFNLNQTNK